MGYYMNQEDSAFIIKKGNQEEVLKRIKVLCSDEYVFLKWVDKEAVVNAQTLNEAIDECWYHFSYDDKGNIIDIQFNGEYVTEEGMVLGKIGNEKKIFDAIAPLVENGSYIEMKGEDDLAWQWEFKRGKCKEIILQERNI